MKLCNVPQIGVFSICSSQRLADDDDALCGSWILDRESDTVNSYSIFIQDFVVRISPLTSKCIDKLHWR